MTEPTAELRRGRLRRLVKGAVLTTAAVFILFSSYVAWWCSHGWGRLVQGPPDAAYEAHEIGHFVPDWMFSPLDAYAKSTLPGGDLLYTVDIWAAGCGMGSWTECHESMLYNKHHITTPSPQESESLESSEKDPFALPRRPDPLNRPL